MANIAPLIIGLIMGVVGVIVLIVNSVNKSNYNSYMNEISASVRDRSYVNDVKKLNDGELIFITAEYKPVDSYDDNFGLKFDNYLVKRLVERYTYSSSKRLLQEEETTEEEAPLIANDSKSKIILKLKLDIRNLKSKSYYWTTDYYFSEKLRIKDDIDLLSFNLKVSTNLIFSSAFEFIQKTLTDSDVYYAKNSITSNTSFFDKYKGVFYGMLYYSSNSFFSTLDDLRITYYQLKTSNKISLIGTKENDRIVPFKNHKNFPGKETFKVGGDIYRLDEFLRLMHEDGSGIYTFFTVFGIVFIVVGLGFILCARQFK